MKQWVEKECQISDFGGKRLVNRYSKILDGFSKSQMGSISASSGVWSETIGAYRVIKNAEVSFNKIMLGHK
jgi:hypothetical protein